MVDLIERERVITRDIDIVVDCDLPVPAHLAFKFLNLFVEYLESDIFVGRPGAFELVECTTGSLKAKLRLRLTMAAEIAAVATFVLCLPKMLEDNGLDISQSAKKLIDECDAKTIVVSTADETVKIECKEVGSSMFLVADSIRPSGEGFVKVASSAGKVGRIFEESGGFRFEGVRSGENQPLDNRDIPQDVPLNVPIILHGRPDEEEDGYLRSTWVVRLLDFGDDGAGDHPFRKRR